MGESVNLSVGALTGRVENIFRKAGLSEEHASALGAVIVAGERDGCKSHGVYRIEGCLRTVKAGKVVPDVRPVLRDDGSAVVRVEAGGGYSCAGFELGAPVLAERAKKLGIAALVINDCTHFSALWPEVERLAAMGVAAIAMCPSYATVAPSGGKQPLLGTNPFAFGWPRVDPDQPYVFDFATSVAARGEIELYQREGRQLPEGWAVDSEGRPTTDPAAALAGAMLPFGGHKGSAISTMIELLAGTMIGDFTSSEALDFLGTTTLAPRHGELIIAMSPQRFAAGRPGDPFARAEVLLEAIAGQGARLPSQRRFAARKRTLSEGITLTAAEAEQLERLEALGLDAIA